MRESKISAHLQSKDVDLHNSVVEDTPIAQEAQKTDATQPKKKLLLVASTGGHLAQLYRLRGGLNAAPDSMWITFKSEQSESLLSGQRAMFVPYIRSRDFLGVWHSFRSTRHLLREERFDGVVSTGAALALGVFARAALSGIPRTYIESVSRVAGPSLTGRILARLRLAQLQTQHAGWADERWQLRSSVLSQFRRVAKSDGPDVSSAPKKLFVTLGTIQPYRFDSLVDALVRSGLINDETIWQLGETTREDLPGDVYKMMSAAQFIEAAKGADVVVTHSGVGTILQLLELGIHPVVVPRRKMRNEHVDDHQTQIARLLEELGVASVAEVDCVDRDLIIEANMWSTVPSGDEAP